MEKPIRTLTLTSAWRLYLLVVGLVVALVLPGSGSIALAADTGTVSGVVVVESAGGPKPVANAEVRLTFGSKSDSRKTGADGKYSFAGLLPGKYTIRVIPPDGLKTKGDGTISVALDAGDTERADFGLIAPATPTPTAVPKTPSPAATAKPETAQGSAAAAAAAAAAQSAPSSLLIPGATPSPVPSGTPQTGAQARTNGSVLAPGSTNPNPSASPAPFLFGTPALVVAAASPTPDLLAVGTRTPTTGDEVLASGPPRRLITSFEALRQTAGGSSTSQLKSWATDTSLVLGVPFRTQIDGTSFSLVNCGPASLTMVLMAFGMDVDPPSVRDYLNHLVGNYDTEQGTSLYVLARIAREAGLTTFGTSAGLQGWSVEAVREQVRAGHPVITLTKYRFLPGHFGSVTDFDHYIVITGLAGEDFVYNDAAYSTEYGYNLLISPSQLERAWGASSVPRHAVAIGFGDSLKPLPIVPRRLTAESLAATAPVDDVQAVAPAAPVRINRGAAAEWLREQMLDKLGARTALGLDLPPTELMAPRTRLTPADLPPSTQAIEERPAGAPVADTAIAAESTDAVDANAVADARIGSGTADQAALAPFGTGSADDEGQQSSGMALWLSPIGLGLMGFGVMLAVVGRASTWRTRRVRVAVPNLRAILRRRFGR